MPFKPKRPCSYPGCPKLTDGRFCEEHAKQEAQRYERYDRDPAMKKRYNRTWKRIRDRYISANPLCEQCEKQGRITPAEEVHHIKPLSRGGTNDPNNLMALCTSCHSEITAREGGRWNRQGRSKSELIKPADTETKYYRVQVGAFSAKANAEATLTKLKEAGFDGYIKYD